MNWIIVVEFELTAGFEVPTCFWDSMSLAFRLSSFSSLLFPVGSSSKRSIGVLVEIGAATMGTTAALLKPQ